MSAHRLTLVTRADCCLCEEMRAVVHAVARQVALELEVVDVDSDPDLVARHGAEVPVLLIDGRKAYKYRVSPRDLLRRLRAEERRRAARQWMGRVGLRRPQ
jgi:Glutaredoxin-like domain (DUF836)